MALTALLLGELSGALATGGVGALAALKAAPGIKAWRMERKESRSTLETMRKVALHQQNVISSYFYMLGDRINFYNYSEEREPYQKDLWRAAKLHDKLAKHIPWMDENTLITLGSIWDDEAALLDSLPCECRRWEKRKEVRPMSDLFSAYDYNHASVMEPFLEAHGKLMVLLAELLERAQEAKAQALNPLGESLAQIPLSSLGENALMKGREKALEAAKNSLGSSDGAALESTLETLGTAAGKNILLSSRAERYLENISVAQSLEEELGDDTLVEGTPVRELVDSIVGDNAAQLRDEVVMPGGKNPADALFSLAQYSAGLRGR